MRREKVNSEAVLISKGSLYIIKDQDRSVLYVNSVVPAPYYCKAAQGSSLTYDGSEFKPYVPQNQFLKDCLHSAEEIMAGKTLKLGDLRSKVKGTNTPFGDTDDKNIEAANEAARTQGLAVNEAADPKGGQAYVIVRTQSSASGVDEYPYHAAAVVADDEIDRITLEVFAGNTDASEKDRSTPGDFSMYSVSPTAKKDSFHNAWKGALGRDSITIVIQPIK